ncbi:hypothetical protein RAB80_005615 [Fusarium oxysporum f. sp. vasinfectum]|nr:hypothetical protein RAB80_005615 [Fusarium oxysporum f. sp. vasinfectum]KAK2687123.1 hypothetical protein QWA68_014310 [Fusarium oxysporum]KAK2939739.1 hypothetical protein FoTM2_002958 [Fusarium oxysporum f. sp. vasinfectum]
MSNLYILNIINKSGEEADYLIDCPYEDQPPVTVRNNDNWMAILNLNQHYVPLTVSVLPEDGVSPSVNFVLAKNKDGR